MLKYTDYLNLACSYYGFLNENEFNEIVLNFSDINSIDYSNFYFDGDNLEQYILNSIIGKEVDGYYVDYIDNKCVLISYTGYPESLSKLNKVKEILNKYGYSIDNYDDLVSEIKINNDENKRHLIKSKIIDKLNEMTVKQLENFYYKCK